MIKFQTKHMVRDLRQRVTSRVYKSQSLAEKRCKMLSEKYVDCFFTIDTIQCDENGIVYGCEQVEYTFNPFLWRMANKDR